MIALQTLIWLGVLGVLALLLLGSRRLAATRDHDVLDVVPSVPRRLSFLGRSAAPVFVTPGGGARLVQAVRASGVELAPGKGSDWWGVCPFHSPEAYLDSADSETLLVSGADPGLWVCFGCGAAGQQADFEQRRPRVSEFGPLAHHVDPTVRER
jgi:hypothetical protein